MSQKNLQNISEKLGLQDPAVLKKGEEFLRAYQQKATLKHLNDIAQSVLCFDLAATQLGLGFDKETALKLSALKKAAYQNSLHNLEKILNLDKPLTVSEICVQFSCTVVKETAENILKKYKEKNSVVDYNHPQYAAIAVFTACKLKNVKVQKSQFVSISRLKSSQWKELEAEFDKFANLLGLKLETKSKQKKAGKELIIYLEDVLKASGTKDLAPNKESKEEKVEDYEVWKKRILEEAREALKNKAN